MVQFNNLAREDKTPFGSIYVQGGGVGVWSYHFVRRSPGQKGSYMSNEQVLGGPGHVVDARMDSGAHPPKIMYFEN